ncbi:hypothetical protein FA95DRAFT_1602761 [Auriscalpium vulgare]|uniref:Uncharacterized protein n=1 Tax=Auriscalpium vulgare TaxID=40419 RepID=A0ACB8S4S4_9AGAM|nr:hypothetical protein FA95DRAFT_1602761 [Auriscalpium vulgare]
MSHDEENIQEIIARSSNPRLALEKAPFRALSCAIRSIIRPTLLFKQAPELLDMLAQVKLIGQRICTVAEQALAIHALSSLQQAGHELLRDAEVKTLKRVANRHDVYHQVYCGAKHTVIRRHIIELWTSSESHLLPVLLRTYFPQMEGITGQAAAEYLFNARMSEKEGDESLTEMEMCFRFVSEAKIWEERYCAERNSDNVDFTDPGFQDLTRKFTRENGIPDAAGQIGTVDAAVELIEWYLARVQNDIQHLALIFPISSALA